MNKSVVLFLVLLSLMFLCVVNTQRVKANESTITIRADGSIDPPTANITSVDNATYTFTGNIYDPIVVERNNTVVDGAGYTLQGYEYSGVGIDCPEARALHNVTVRNTIINGWYFGISLSDSYNSSIHRNNITDCLTGIHLSFSEYNSISGNNITSGSVGINLYMFCHHNNIVRNSITKCGSVGIAIQCYSSYNSVIENDVEENGRPNDQGYGIEFATGFNNTVYHNNFVNNPQQAYSDPSITNFWDNGYPSGGNYWNNYAVADLHSGPYQNETDIDEIGDIPYIINAKNKDSYPLMRPWAPFEGQPIGIRADGKIDPSGAPLWRKGDMYTFMSNIVSNYDGIIIQKNNVTVDGAGHTIEGSATFAGGAGFNLTSINLVTIKNTKIANFDCGIYLSSSSNNILSGNVFVGDGLLVSDSYGNVVMSNTVNAKPLVYLERTSNQTVAEAGQVVLVNCEHIQVQNLTLSHTTVGLQLWKTNNTLISGNDITNNYEGIWLQFSSNNILCGNNIASNTKNGIYLSDSWNNTIYHNNFISNARQVTQSSGGTNAWDDGYPSGGNFWNDYAGKDLYSGPYQNETGSDGIGDTKYTIQSKLYYDSFPFISPFTMNNAGTWDGVSYTVDVVSNSTISDFYFNPNEGAFVRFNVTGKGGTGFCKVAIPKQLLWVESGEWQVLVDNVPVTPTIADDANYSYLYFTYSHSTKTVEIRGTNARGALQQSAPFPTTWIVAALAIIATTAVTGYLFLKRKSSRTISSFSF